MSDNKGYLIEGHYYQYDLQWLIDKLFSFEDSIKTVIDLQTIHYADPIQWNITTQYSPNTVVVDPQNGTAYMSKQAVPAGVQLTNEDYWVVIFNYQQIYEKICTGVAYNNKDSAYATKDFLVNDLVWYNLDLYRVTRAISTGGQLIPGTNLTPTSIESLLSTYYGRDRTAQVMNDTVNITGDYTLNAGDIATTSTNRTVKVTKDNEVDVDGNDSLHVDGTTTINRGDIVTEINGSDRSMSVEGANTEHYKGASNVQYDSTYVFTDGNSRKVNMSHRSVNVKDYGAKGDGTTDDYQAFVDAISHTSDGDYIVIPQGTYNLSANPYPVSNNVISTNPADYNTGYRNFIVSSGAQFKGAAIGSPTTGAGKFFSAFSTNPWLIVAGNSDLYNLNHVDPTNAQKGAIIGDCKELASVDTTVPTGIEHRWYALEYRGANTGNVKNPKANVELLNQVINVTGCTGICTEIDLNNFTDDTGAFSVALFITGGGTGKSNMTAIDINKDDIATDWVSGLNVRRARTCISGVLVENGTGAQFTRASDTAPSGFYLNCLTASGVSLARIDANGFIFGAGFRDINNNSIQPPVGIDVEQEGTFTSQEVTLSFTLPAGYKYGICAEAASIGFVAPVSVLTHTDNTVTLYVAGTGTGKVKARILCI